MVPGQQYYLQISGEDEVDVSSFTLTLNNNTNCTQCAQNISLTASPDPVNGIYQAGTTVIFCTTIESFTQVSSHWVHGISPLNFGPGWDMSTLAPSGTVTPTNTTWIWTSTGVPQAGWYVDSDNDGSVNDNYGDLNMDANMTACFEITTVSNVNCVDGASAALDVETYSDGETGSYTSGSCTGDPVPSFSAIVSCCDFPLITSSPETCPNAADGIGTVQGQGGTSPYDYVWENSGGTTIFTDNNIAGISTLGGLAPGLYTITVTDDNGCVKITDITILPGSALTATAVATPSLCAGSPCSGTLAGSATGGSGYTYSWDAGPNTSNQNQINVCAGTYLLTVTSGGCSATTTATVTAPPLLVVTE